MRMQVDTAQLSAHARSIGIVIDQVRHPDGSVSLSEITSAIPGSQASAIADRASQQYRKDQQLLIDRIRAFEDDIQSTANHFTTTDAMASQTLETISQLGR
jgi:hypothetical protein